MIDEAKAKYRQFKTRQKRLDTTTYSSQCFKDTVGAYQKVRQKKNLHNPAFMAALESYIKHEGEASAACSSSAGVSSFLEISILRRIGLAYTAEMWISF